MKLRNLAALGLLPLLCSCNGNDERQGFHKVAVAWPPGYEFVPDCNPLIKMSGTTVNIKGVKVTTPVGVGVEGGEFTRDQKALQTATDAAQQADQRFTRLCRLIPMYANDKTAFYRVRDQMFDLIAGTTTMASAVAVQTGQMSPTAPASVPTASTDAAKSAGVNAAKGVNLPASASVPIVGTNKGAVTAAAAKLTKTVKKGSR